MKIAVLGANGFIGSYLCTYLWSRGFDVIPVTRQTLDLTNPYSMNIWINQENPSVIINAAISGGGPTVNDINYEDVRNNLTIFFNFFNATLPIRYINIGSGAEFDRQTDIHQVRETEVLYRHPTDSYGFSKNIISRAIREKDNFFTLRLFGCFHSSEPLTRLFKRFLSGQINSIQDKLFDYFSLADFSRVIEFYCITESTISLPKDINCVYKEKYLLSEILGRINQIKKLDIPIYTDGKKHLSYTGHYGYLDMLCTRKDFPELDGLEKGLEQYE